MITLEELRKKAKAYDEAIERAKKFIEENLLVQNLNTWIKETFPELRESEDERIRKEIITLIQSCDKGCYTTISPSRIKEYTAWLEKQGEQKPAEKVEPKFKVKYAGSEYNVLEIKDIAGVAFYGIEDEPNHIDYVKAENCEIIDGYAIKENGSPYPTKSAVFFGAKNPTWNEKDESHLIHCVRLINNAEGCSISEQENAIEWLKSLKDRYTWKPSDEQMDALKHYVDTTMDGDIDLLYQDLKELKGE